MSVRSGSGELSGPVTGEEPTVHALPLPNGEYVAVTIQLALEAWSDGATTGNVLGHPLPQEALDRGIPDWATISDQMYGGRTGLQRLLGVLNDYGCVASCSVSGLAAEKWPGLVRTISERHEIVGHGWAHEQVTLTLDEAEDLSVIRRSTDALESVTGERPVGWSSQGSRRGNYTVGNLLREGYVYTNDFRDADTPYVVAEHRGRRLLAMPRTDQVNDYFLLKDHANPPSTFVEYFKRSFDQLYAEGRAGHPKVATCVMHGTILGRPWGASVLAECLDYIKEHEGVWTTTRRAVAEHYLANV